MLHYANREKMGLSQFSRKLKGVIYISRTTFKSPHDVPISHIVLLFFLILQVIFTFATTHRCTVDAPSSEKDSSSAEFLESVG